MCASKCVTDLAVYSQPSSRRLSSKASLSFATAALMACHLCHTCTHIYCMHTVTFIQRGHTYGGRDVREHQHAFSPPEFISVLAQCTQMQNGQGSGGWRDREKLHSQKNVLTSAAVLIQAQRQPLHFACCVRQSILGTAECINYTCTAIDPLSNPADCLHPPRQT